MTHGAAGVDDVGHIALAFRRLGADQRLARTAQNLGRIVLVQENGADRVFSDRPNAVDQQQPAVVQFDRRAAIADLNELPRVFRPKKGLAAFP